MHWIGIHKEFGEEDDRRRHGRERLRRKLLKGERHGRKSRRCQHTGPNGEVSRKPYAPQGAKGID
jgi:hypothetical protein